MSSLIGQTLDHYRVIERIGQGGMATVYLAIDTRSQAEVALKVLSPTMSSDRRFVKRFRREAQLVSQLKHENIVPVLAYGQYRARKAQNGSANWRTLWPSLMRMV
jgi:serine/threonine-protein kinase